MATIINAPMGISEASMMSRAVQPIPSDLLAKRSKMKDMLISKLCKEYGSDAMRVAVITREVENAPMLKSGKLTAETFNALEKAVKAAVTATRPGPMQSHMRPPAKIMTGGEMYEEVKKVANWTDVANHRASYYAIEQDRNEAKHESRKVELRQRLAHQMSQEKHKETARQQMLSEEAREVSTTPPTPWPLLFPLAPCHWPLPFRWPLATVSAQPHLFRPLAPCCRWPRTSRASMLNRRPPRNERRPSR